MRWQHIYEVPVGFSIALAVSFVVLNSKPIQDVMRKAIRKEYNRTGRIHYSAWILHPLYCGQLKRSGRK
jgi:hypothetical protein